MRHVLFVGCLLLLTGCQGVVGPRQHRDDPVQVDHPCLTMEEQQRLGRDRLSIPEASTRVAPKTYAEIPGPYQR